MLTADSPSWFSSGFTVSGPAGDVVAEIRLSWWREAGTLAAGGTTYAIRRAELRGPFILESTGGAEAARAEKPSAFRREFTIAHGNRQYILKRLAWSGRTYVLVQDGLQVGSIAPRSWFSRGAIVDCSDGVPVVVQAFALWLVLIMWRRDGAAAA